MGVILDIFAGIATRTLSKIGKEGRSSESVAQISAREAGKIARLDMIMPGKRKKALTYFQSMVQLAGTSESDNHQRGNQ